MEWREVVEHPCLQDLPFKIETNAEGYIMMTPSSGEHSGYQGHIIEWLLRLGQWGLVRPEFPIQTTDGIKVADVAWGSKEFFKRNAVDGRAPLVYKESPEVVVEVKSPSNSIRAMEGKMLLYFEAGAKEVWFCDKDGKMRFFKAEGELKRSGIFGQFPEHIDTDFM